MHPLLTIWRSESRRCWLVAAVLAGVTVATFAPAFDCGWVNFDDYDYVTENLHVSQGLNTANVGWAFTTFHNANWHPLTWLSLQLDASLGGVRAGGYHLTNVLVHAVNAALLFLALRALTGAFWRSAAVALLFAVHPLRAESVAWVSERKDVLSACFGFLALWGYAAYVRRPSAGRYLAVALALTASLMCKPMTVTLPFLLLVLDWWPLRRVGIGSHPREEEPTDGGTETTPRPRHQNGFTGTPKAREARRATVHSRPIAVGSAGQDPGAGATVKSPEAARSFSGGIREVIRGSARTWSQLAVEKVPLFALVAISSAVTFYAQESGGAVGGLNRFSLTIRLENAAISYATYLSKTVWPTRLSPFYSHPGEGVSGWEAAGSLLLLTVLTVTAVALRRRAPYVLAGWLWFLGTLVPVIGVVQVGKQGMADRYTYLSQIGLLISACWGAEALLRNRSWKVALAPGAAIVLTLAFLTNRQVSIWHDSVALWKNAILATGGSVNDLLSLASACEDLGYWEDAKKFYQDILIERDPNSARAMLDLGSLISEQGDHKDGLRLIDEALKREPDLGIAHMKRGLVLYRLGQIEEAAAEFETALKKQPLLRDAAYNLGLAKVALGDDAAAVDCFEKALRLKPDFAEAHSVLGNTLLRMGRTSESFSHLQAAVRHDPKYVDGHINLGKGLASRGQQYLNAAAEEFEQAIRIVEQETLAEKKDRLRPSLAIALFNLGAARAYQERPEDAVRCMIKAVETDPGETKYRDYLNKYVESLRATEGKERLRGIEDLLRQLPAK
jgi:protein O-mannosyl-transferase